jgi:hypothetical protein
MTTNVLYQDEWVTLSHTPISGLVRYARTSLAYRDPADLARSYAGLGALMPRILPGMKLLVDLRLAPPRNDPEFEAKANSAISGFVTRFAKHATLVRTAAGKLQTARLAHASGIAVHVFDDEDAALDYLGVIRLG